VFFKKIGGFQIAFEGAEDYDLILRITEQVDPSTIAHIPQILYHSRITEKSAHEPFPAKSVIAAGKRAVCEALRRRHEQAVIEDGLFPGSYRVRYEISGNPEVTIIIPTKDKAELVRKCVNSIITKTKYQNYRILLVENQSSEQETFTLYDCLLQNPNINLIRYDRPFNFSAMNNYAVSQVRSPYILFLNNDIEVISGEWLSSMIEHIQRVGVGAVGAKLMYPDNTVQHAGVIIGICGIAGHSHRYFPAGNHGYLGRADIVQDVSAVTAACMIMKKEFFVELKGFDEDLIVAYNDVDLCLRIRQSGRLIIYTPYARLYHHESVSRGNDRMPEKVQRAQREFAFMRTRWGSVIDRGDPYYNPNLTCDREDFSRK
jgi:GT2 family glycosyltransferase